MSTFIRVLGVAFLGGMLGASSPAQSSERVVLNPGQEVEARALFGADAPELGDGVRLGAIRLVADRVEVELKRSNGSVQVQLYSPDRSPRRALKLSAGGLVLPEHHGLSAHTVDALVARLKGKAPLSYRQVQQRGRAELRAPSTPRDLEAAQREAARLTERVAARLSGEVIPLEESRLAPSVMQALEALRSGDAEGCLAALRPSILGGEARPPEGAISLWLAAGGLDTPEGCDPGVRCPLSRFRQTSSGHFSRINPQALGMLSAEPRALTLLAVQLMEQSRADEAAASLWLALAAPLGDPAAFNLAARWGWTNAPPPLGGALPEHSFEGLDVDWGAPLAALVFFVLGGLMVARNHRTTRLGLALLSVFLGGLTWSLFDVPEVTPERPNVPQAALEFGRGGPCELGAPWPSAHLWRMEGRCEGAEVTLSLVPSARESSATHHEVRLEVRASDGAYPKALRQWERDLDAQAKALSSITLQRQPPGAQQGGGIVARVSEQTPLMRRALRVSAVVAAMALPGLITFLWQILASFGSSGVIAHHRRIVLLVLALVALLTHAFTPSRMVMVFGGYDQVQHLAQAEALRYGPGAIWIYGPWLWLTGVDHTVIQTLNRGLGFVSLLALWGLAAALVPGRPRVPLLLAAMTATAPIMWRDHASESLLVGGVLFGLVGVWGVLRQRDPVDWLLALPCLALAALTRPEFALVLSVLAPALILSRGRAFLVRERFALSALFLSVLALGWVHYETMAAWVGALRASSALESVGLFELLWRVFSRDTFEVVWGYGPLALIPAILAAFWVRSHRRLVWLLVVVAAFWAALTRIDLPQVSIPRVHAPIWLLWCLVGALGLDHLVGYLMRQARTRRLIGGVVLSTLWITSAGATLGTIYQPTNADAEEALIQDARRHIGEAPFGALATILSQDPPPNGKASRAFPSYLFNQPERPLVLSGLSELEHHWPQDGEPVYALLGVRCYAEMREDTGAPPPKDARPVRACADFRDTWRLETVIERDIVNQGDRSFPMYPASPTLSVGFYRVIGPK